MFYIIYKKNLHLCPSKIAYETIRLSQEAAMSKNEQLIVLGVSSTKFNVIVNNHPATVRHSPDVGVTTCALVQSDKPITF